MPEVQVENIVISCPIAQTLDLAALASALAHARYKPEESPALMLPVSRPRAAVFLTAAGEMTVTGVTSLAEGEEVVGMMRERLGLLGVSTVPHPEVTVRNVVASLEYGAPLPLRSVGSSLDVIPSGQEGFPGLMVRSEDPNTVILLFDSGKMVADGPSVDAVSAALTRVASQLASEVRRS